MGYCRGVKRFFLVVTRAMVRRRRLGAELLIANLKCLKFEKGGGVELQPKIRVTRSSDEIMLSRILVLLFWFFGCGLIGAAVWKAVRVLDPEVRTLWYSPVLPSLRDLGMWRWDPSVETLGFFRGVPAGLEMEGSRG
jgi:hypothetical protein